MNIQIAVTDADINACCLVMHELRPHIVIQQFLSWMRNQEKIGFQLAYVREPTSVVAVAGFRISENLAWGKFVYVDDLITLSTHRSKGYGAALLAWLIDYAEQNGCAQLHLDSGVQRKDAHRFYEREGMTLMGYHFSQQIQSDSNTATTKILAINPKAVKPKLISFVLCPFVQRAAIVLAYKQIEYDIEYINLADPPTWFLELSPLKKVPVLQVGDQVIFESAVIMEYLDEAYPSSLHPRDVLKRAKNRSWIEFGNECMWDLFHLTTKETESEFNEVLAGLLSKFDTLEKVIKVSLVAPYFNGDTFALVDASYAPLFRGLQYLDEIKPVVFDRARHPKITLWKDGLLKFEAVLKSSVPEIKDLFLAQLWKKQGYLATFLDKTKYSPSIKKSLY